MQTIESVMLDIANIFTTNLDTEINSVNTKSGDTLLNNLVADNANYFTWEIKEVPPYPVYFLQDLTGKPKLQTNGCDNSIIYNMRVTCFINVDATHSAPIQKTRYDRVLVNTFSKYVVTKYVSSEIIGMDTAMLEDINGALLDVSAIIFSIAITI